MRDDQLMRNGAGKKVADRVDHPEAVVNGKRATHFGEADKGDDGEDCPHQDQLAGTETMDDHGAEPDGERGRQRESKYDIGARPEKLALEIIVEESDVVIRNADRKAEREEGRGSDPPAEELTLHRIHCGTRVNVRPAVAARIGIRNSR